MRLPTAVLITGGLALVLASCAGGDPICINGGTDCTRGPIIERSFATDVMPIWVDRCDTDACHGINLSGNLGLLATCTEIFDELLGEARLDQSDGPTGPRVLPADTASTAFFLLKSQNLSVTTHGGSGAIQSGSAQYNILADWINGPRINDCP